MKIKSLFLSLQIFILIFTGSVRSQNGWKWITPYPHGNAIYSIAVTGNYTYFLSNMNTVSVTSDSGKTVNNLSLFSTPKDNTGLEQAIAFADSLNGFLLYSSEEFRTTDGGKTWMPTFKTGLHEVTFADSKTGWEIGASSILKTTNGGQNWFNLPSSNWSSNEYLSCIYALDSLNVWVISSSHDPYKGVKIFYSRDGGNTWSFQNEGFNSNSINQVTLTALKINSSGLGILTASIKETLSQTPWIHRSVILRTEDFGKTWAVIDSSIAGDLSSIISVNDSIWVIHGTGKDNGNMTLQYRSTDFGRSFTGGTIIKPEVSNAFFSISAYNPQQKVIFLATFWELYRSLDYGLTYTRVTSETALNVFDFALDNNGSGPQKALAVSRNDNAYLFSKDGGRTWTKDLLEFSSQSEYMIGVSLSMGMAYIFTSENVYKSAYGDRKWIRTSYPDFFRPNSYFYSGSYGGDKLFYLFDTYAPPLYYSADGGAQWISSPTPANYTFNSLKFTGSEDIIGCGSYRNSSVENGFIFAGSSGGTNWKITQTKEVLKDIFMLSKSTGYCLSDYKLLMTKDNWNSLQQVFDSSPNAFIDAVVFEDSVHGILRTSNYHFYETFDKGNSWNQSGIEMPMLNRVEKMQYNNQGDLLVLGDRGLIVKLSEKSTQNKTEEQGSSQKLSYELFQNYPNPFNPVTQIGFRLSKKGGCELKVYDVLGREVVTLLNETKEAGDYSVSFNASELPSGIYIYRLKAGTQVFVRKMLLLK